MIPLLLPGLYRHDEDAEQNVRVHDTPMSPDALVVRGTGRPDHMSADNMKDNADRTWDRLEGCGIADRPGISTYSMNDADLDAVLAQAQIAHDYVGVTTVAEVNAAGFSIQPTNWAPHASLWLPPDRIDDLMLWVELQRLFSNIVENPYSSSRRAQRHA